MAGLIAVTGATGVVGGRVARLLAERGVAQRLVVRDAGRAPELPGADVRVARGYGAAGEMRAALGGAATLFLLPAEEAPDRVAQHVTAVDAALAEGVRRARLAGRGLGQHLQRGRVRGAGDGQRRGDAADRPRAADAGRLRPGEPELHGPRHGSRHPAAGRLDCPVHRRTGRRAARSPRAPEKGGPHDADPLPALSAALVR